MTYRRMAYTDSTRLDCNEGSFQFLAVLFYKPENIPQDLPTGITAFIREEAHYYLLATRFDELIITVSSCARVSAAYRMAACISSRVSLG